MSKGRCSTPGCEKLAQLVGKCIEHGDVPRILDAGHMTHREIAEVLGVTTSAVWLIERRALMKVRREFKRRGLALADFFDN